MRPFPGPRMRGPAGRRMRRPELRRTYWMFAMTCLTTV